MFCFFPTEIRSRSLKIKTVFLFDLAFLPCGSFYAAWDNAGINGAE